MIDKGIYTFIHNNDDYVCIVLSQKLFCIISLSHLLAHYYSIPSLTLPSVSEEIVNTYVGNYTEELSNFQQQCPFVDGYLGQITEENFEKIMEQIQLQQMR